MDPRPPSILSVCAGYGGIDLGLELAIPGARTVCFVEIEATAADVLVSRMEDGALPQAPIWTDLKTFDGRPWRGRVDILTAGYPCQPFSCAGLQRGEEDPRHLFPHVARIIGEVQPAVVFLENVENHLRVGFEQVARELRELGYQLEAGIFSAQEVRAPHLRKRLFVLAYRESGGLAVLGQPSRLDGFIDGRDQAMANTGDRQLQVARRRPQKRAGSGSAVANVADATGPQLRGRTRSQHGSERQPRKRSSAGNSTFPPGLADIDGWRAYLRRNPQAEPAIRRSADGTASRVDRLRMLGNGVVPLVAAYAFRSLAGAAVAANDATQSRELAAAA